MRPLLAIPILAAALLLPRPVAAQEGPPAPRAGTAAGVSDSLLVSGAFQPEGMVSLRVERRVRGAPTPEVRALLERPGRQAATDFIRATAAGMGLEGRLTGVNLQLPHGPGEPLVATFALEVPATALYRQGPESGTGKGEAGGKRTGRDAKAEVEVALPLPLPLFRLPETPWELPPGPRREVHRAELALPPGVEVIPPVPLRLQEAFGSYRATSRLEDGTLITVRELTLTPPETGDEPEERAYRHFRSMVTAGHDLLLTLRAAATADYAGPVPDDADALARAGLAARRDGEHERAVELLTRAVELDPAHPQAWKYLGTAYLHLDRLGRAEEAFRRQIEVAPETEHLYASLGTALERQGRLEEAEAAYRRELERDADDIYATVGLASLLVQTGRVEEAAPLLEAVRERKIGERDVRLALAWALTYADRPGAAIPILEEMVEADSTAADAHALLGEALEKAGEPAPAIRHLRAAVRHAPEVAIYRSNLARALARQGRDGEAVPILREGLEELEERRASPEDRRAGRLCRDLRGALARLDRPERLPAACGRMETDGGGG